MTLTLAQNITDIPVLKHWPTISEFHEVMAEEKATAVIQNHRTIHKKSVHLDLLTHQVTSYDV
jgi:hypothetical protein